jgi:hypothetical protein
VTVVYRFRTWEISSDTFRESQRWATEEAIKRVSGEIISDGFEVEDRFLGREVDGMTG